jgi:hypothetical protein
MNGHGPKEYGKHKYADHDGTSDCENQCGCWIGPTNSGGPLGLDPFGLCPKNPVDGNLLGGKEDYGFVVRERIRLLELRAHKAEDQLKRVRPTKKQLAADLLATRTELAEKKALISGIRRVTHIDP